MFFPPSFPPRRSIDFWGWKMVAIGGRLLRYKHFQAIRRFHAFHRFLILLFNRDPYFMAYETIPIEVGSCFFPLLHLKQPGFWKMVLWFLLEIKAPLRNRSWFWFPSELERFLISFESETQVAILQRKQNWGPESKTKDHSKIDFWMTPMICPVKRKTRRYVMKKNKRGWDVWGESNIRKNLADSL